MKKKKTSPKIRHSWSRKPVQQSHGTKKGKKGYSRKKPPPIISEDPKDPT